MGTTCTAAYVGEHVHQVQEQIYYVLEGEGRTLEPEAMADYLAGLSRLPHPELNLVAREGHDARSIYQTIATQDVRDACDAALRRSRITREDVFAKIRTANAPRLAAVSMTPIISSSSTPIAPV